MDDLRFGENEIELIIDCLIQGNGFKDFEKRGLPDLQEKTMQIKKSISSIKEWNGNPFVFLTVIDSIKRTVKDSLLQELAEQMLDAIELTQRAFKKNEVVFKALTQRELFKEGGTTRKDVLDAVLDNKNILPMIVLITSTVGRIIHAMAYGIDSSETTTENERVPNGKRFFNTRGL